MEARLGHDKGPNLFLPPVTVGSNAGLLVRHFVSALHCLTLQHLQGAEENLGFISSTRERRELLRVIVVGHAWPSIMIPGWLNMSIQIILNRESKQLHMCAMRYLGYILVTQRKENCPISVF